MTETLLHNLRLLGLPSETQGRDWRELTRKIDELIGLEGLELSEESIFLLFNRGPGSVVAGEATCFVVRPVIGPSRPWPAPYQVVDWKSAPVHLYEAKSTDWTELWNEALEAWEGLHREGKPVAPGFMVRLKRRDENGLRTSIEVLFRS